jgi:hypothetical protein
MPGCVLRAASETFDVDAFLRSSEWQPASVHRKGERPFPKSPRVYPQSGFNVVISDKERIEDQVSEALSFISQHEAEIRRLVGSAGIDNVVLDFGTWFRDVVTQSEFFSAALVRAAAAIGLALEVSMYPPE